MVRPFPVTHHTYMNGGDTEFYSAEVMGEYPQGFYGRPEALRTLLDLAPHAAKKNLEPLGFTFSPRRELKAGAYPGREFSAASEQAGARGRMQIYATPSYVYIFNAFKRGDAPAAGFERFFGSVTAAPK